MVSESGLWRAACVEIRRLLLLVQPRGSSSQRLLKLKALIWVDDFNSEI